MASVWSAASKCLGPVPNCGSPIDRRVAPAQTIGTVRNRLASTALPDILTAELAARGQRRTFPDENVARSSSDHSERCEVGPHAWRSRKLRVDSVSFRALWNLQNYSLMAYGNDPTSCALSRYGVKADYDIRFTETTMKNSTLSTLPATLVATISLNGLSTSTSARNPKLSLSKMACILSVFFVATAILSSAQTQFKSLLSFDGNNGANPHFVTLVQGQDGELYGTTTVSTGSGGTVFKATTGGTLTTLYTFCLGGEPCLDGSKPNAGLVMNSNGFYGTTMNGGINSDGTVFKIESSGDRTTLHDFDGTDGAEPMVTLTVSNNGSTLYGTTSIGGGIMNDGTAFQISSAGAFSKLHSFMGTDGEYPNVSMVAGSNGNLYGATLEGGSFDGSGTGTFYEMTPGGKVTPLHTFEPAQVAGSSGAIIQGKNGNFYGTDIGGGNGAGTIYEVTPAGDVTVLYTFCSETDCKDGSTPYGAMIIGSDGNFYGTTYAGGANTTACNAGCGTLFQITPAGKLTTLHSFCSEANCTDGSQPEGGLLQETNGTFYGTTYSGGTNNLGTIYSLSTATTQTPFVKPLQKSANTGATVTILGNNLTGATQVLFNGIAAAFTVISSTEIKAIVPAGATTGAVTVVTPRGTLKTIVVFYVTPQIKSFTPTSGPVGTEVTITGVSLTGTTEVTFGGVAATSFTVDSNTKVTATVPEEAKTGPIAITTAGGTVTSTSSFTVTE